MTCNQTTLQQAKAQGFTLIELIMVIVILGILSAFALPKFADFTGDAESSSIEGAKGTVRSASAIAHAACLATDNCNASAATSNVTLEGVSVAMVYGYPSVAGIQDASALDGYALTVDGTDLIVSINTSDGSPCFTYSQATQTGTNPISAPTISAVATFDSANTECN
ncbi:type II secretion system protein [Bermanella marisrubri]|nr:type II secretion system protein [Bermanella marisrubri]